MKNDKLFLYMLLILVPFVLTGCLAKDLYEVKKEEKEYLRLAKEKAREYLKAKYGISFSDSNIYKYEFRSSASTTNDLDTHKTGDVILYIQKDQKDYKVNINVLRDDESYMYDDYEKEIINDNFTNYLHANLNVNQNKIKIIYLDNLLFNKHMHDKFTNINSFLTEYGKKQSTEMIVVVNEELDADKVKKTFDSLNEITNTKVVFIQSLSKDINDWNLVPFHYSLPKYEDTIVESFNVDEYYLDKFYACSNSICSEYKGHLIELSDDVYVRYLENNSIGSIINFNKIELNETQKKKFEDKISSCYYGKINAVYQVDVKKDNSYFYNVYGKQSTIANYNVIFIDNDKVSCQTMGSNARKTFDDWIKVKIHFNKEDEKYIVIVDE